MKIKLMNLKDNKELIKIIEMLNIKIEYLDDYKDLGMMVFCEFSDEALDLVLKTLRLSNIKVPLKAIETDTNKDWSSVELYEELFKEYLYYLNKSTSI